VVKVDAATNTAVLQIRDSNNGDVVAQYPSEQQLRAYREAAGQQQDLRQNASRAEVAEKAAGAVNQSTAVQPAQEGEGSSLSDGRSGGTGGQGNPAPAMAPTAPAMASTAPSSAPAPKAPTSGGVGAAGNSSKA
jgi:hypothetical protein